MILSRSFLIAAVLTISAKIFHTISVLFYVFLVQLTSVKIKHDGNLRTAAFFFMLQFSICDMPSLNLEKNLDQGENFRIFGSSSRLSVPMFIKVVCVYLI